MQVYEGKVCPPGEGKIAIIVARFNRSITEHLLEGALAVLRRNAVSEVDITVIWVPGAFELPTLAQRFALDEDYQAVICLGCVIKGETSHDEHINRAVSLELARIGVENGIPVIFGLLTCNTKEQALARSGLNEQSYDKMVDSTVGNKGAEAAEAALEMLHLLEQIPLLPYSEDFPNESILANTAEYRKGRYDDRDDQFEDRDTGDESFEEIDESREPGWFLPGKKSDHQPSESSDRRNAPQEHRGRSDGPSSGKREKHSSEKKSSFGKKPSSSGHSSGGHKGAKRNDGAKRNSSAKGDGKKHWK